MDEELPELVVGDLSYVAGAAPESGDPGSRVRRRAPETSTVFCIDP